MPAPQATSEVDCTPARPDLLFALEVRLCTPWQYLRRRWLGIVAGGAVLKAGNLLRQSSLTIDLCANGVCSLIQGPVPAPASAWSTRSVQRMPGSACVA